MKPVTTTSANWPDQYTPDQLAHIAKYWNRPPPECCGKCMMHDFIILWCGVCHWSEEMPFSNDSNTF